MASRDAVLGDVVSRRAAHGPVLGLGSGPRGAGPRGPLVALLVRDGRRPSERQRGPHVRTGQLALRPIRAIGLLRSGRGGGRGPPGGPEQLDFVCRPVCDRRRHLRIPRLGCRPWRHHGRRVHHVRAASVRNHHAAIGRLSPSRVGDHLAGCARPPAYDGARRRIAVAVAAARSDRQPEANPNRTRLLPVHSRHSAGPRRPDPRHQRRRVAGHRGRQRRRQDDPHQTAHRSPPTGAASSWMAWTWPRSIRTGGAAGSQSSSRITSHTHCPHGRT